MPLPHAHSFFLSLTYPDLAAVTPLPAALWNNTDVAHGAAGAGLDLLRAAKRAGSAPEAALRQFKTWWRGRLAR